jgi:hypothetical protein
MLDRTTTHTETRRTDWIAFGHYGYTHYRIWQRHTPMEKWQRHEWRSEDGASCVEKWIRVPFGFGWATDATPVTEAEAA